MNTKLTKQQVFWGFVNTKLTKQQVFWGFVWSMFVLFLFVVGHWMALLLVNLILIVVAGSCFWRASVLRRRMKT
jgi:hypothetical protein